MEFNLADLFEHAVDTWPDREYLVARAIQCFVPGIPQIYYVGLLAGTNDLDLLRGAGREGQPVAA